MTKCTATDSQHELYYALEAEKQRRYVSPQIPQQHSDIGQHMTTEGGDLKHWGRGSILNTQIIRGSTYVNICFLKYSAARTPRALMDRCPCTRQNFGAPSEVISAL
jgi:hypothetical protein